jgi:DNA-directed RNA polymerase subunit RPC12/RpoP
MSTVTLHDLAVSPRPIVGVECDHCIHRALLTAETVRATVGDRRTLEEAGVRCAKCRSRKFTVTRFQTRSAAHAFMRNL